MLSKKVDRPSISIHPPRAGRDMLISHIQLKDMNFNPPSPCGEGQELCDIFGDLDDFNPPSPCGEGLLSL